MKRNGARLSEFIEAAGGKKPVDLCIRNCRLVNVFTGRIEETDVAVHDGHIAGWGRYEAEKTFDAQGMFLCPGFIDGHIHIESTMLSPARFCAAAAPWGTAAVVADPHEIANVLGERGIRYMLDATEGAPVDVYLNLPSCVPATSMETAGAELRASDLFSMLPHPRILGLAEMMNFPGVLNTFPDVIDKLVFFQNGIIDGHAPMLAGTALNAYVAAGISSDHECTRPEEAMEKLSKGMAIMLREGSQSKDLAALLPVVDDQTWPRCMFVSDDRHPDDLTREGHMNAVVNRAVELGMDPVRALTLATLTPAHHFGLMHRGAVAPGYFADFSLSPTLTPWIPKHVFKAGVEIARAGKLLIPSSTAVPASPESPMRLGPVDAGRLQVPAGKGNLRVIDVREGTLLTEKLSIPPKIENGFAVADTERDILKLVVFNRYTPDRPPAVAFVRGIGLKRGALACTVAHDSHNLIAVGTSDHAIIQAVEALRKARGGMAAADGDSRVEVLPLPVAGLMSDEPAETVAHKLELLNSLGRDWGSPLRAPFMALSFLALPVIPELKLTDRGLVDVAAFSFVPLFEG